MKLNSRVIFSLIGFTVLGILAIYSYKLRSSQIMSPSVVQMLPNGTKPNKVTTKRDVTTTRTPNGNTTTTIKELSIIEVRKDNKITTDVTCRDFSVFKNTCKPIYGIGYERRIMESPVFVGGGVNTEGDVKLSMSVEF